MQTSTPKRTQNLILFLGIIVLFSTVSLFATNTAFMVTNEIYHGVTVGDIPVGGLTPAAAEAKLAAASSDQIKKPVITIEHYGTTWPIMASDIDLAINTKALASQAYNVGRTGNILFQLKERYLTVNRGNNIPMSLSYNHEKLASLIKGIAHNVDHSPQNASIHAEGSHIRLVPETVGVKTEVERTLAEITTNLNSSLTMHLKLPVAELYPAIRNTDLAAVNGLITSYSTEFDSRDLNRSQNIYLAAKSIHGTLVKAGEEFSFNTNVGPRLAQNGYKEAPVFIDGKLVPDFGGGVCQVSSTLYNAILLSDMAIVERTPHFRPPGYVPLGQDATVADNLLDFRFKNTGSSNIYITSEIIGNQLTILVYGKKTNNMPEIKVFAGETKIIEPNTIIKQDADLELGKQIIEIEGQKGFHVTTFRVKYENGQEVKREFLATDDFKPVDHVIRIGTKLPKPTK